MPPILLLTALALLTATALAQPSAVLTDARDGKSYRTVKIGEQVWMAENLNFEAEGSKCYDNKAENCAKYGRLYTWGTAMVLPSECDSIPCASQVSAKHQGICPNGWHVPSNTDWNILINYIDGTGGDALRDSPTAGTKLKATSGWNSYSAVPNGTNEFGFVALPGGYGRLDSDGSFGGVGGSGNWWSATEDNEIFAYRRCVHYATESAWHIGLSKDYFLVSVRCVRD